MLSNCGAGEDSWESLELQGDQTSQSLRKSILNIHWKDWSWSWSSNALAARCEELTLLGKDPEAGKDWSQEVKGMTEDKMAGWHHQLNGQKFAQSPGDGGGQGKPDMLQSMGPQRVWQNWATEQCCTLLDWVKTYAISFKCREDVFYTAVQSSWVAQW